MRRLALIMVLAGAACSKSAPSPTDAGGGTPDAGTAPDAGGVRDAGNLAPGLAYLPPSSGKIQLVRDPSSTATTIVLDLTTTVPLTGFSVGFNLPLDATRVRLSSPAFLAGSALPAGASPPAAGIALPTSGPLTGVLVAAQSQKGSGNGAAPADSAVPVGAVLFTVRLDAAPDAGSGVVFDGAALGQAFSAGFRDRSGNDVVQASEFGIGRLELH
jgi:hypothetical protein